MTKKVLYPMHEKLKALGTGRGTVQSFIDWLYDEKEWFIAEPDRSLKIDERLMPVRLRREDIMAEFFEIDLTVLDDEKRAMLDRCRELNEKASV